MCNDHTRTLRLLGGVTIFIVVISISLIGWLYLHMVGNEKARLIFLARSQVHQLELMSNKYLELPKNEGSQSSLITYLQEIFHAQSDHLRFAETGEVILVSSQEKGGMNSLASTEIHSKIFQSLRLAGKQPGGFAGSDQTFSLSDVHGNVFLAAFVPLHDLPLGIVAKISIQELQRPFVFSGIVTILLEIGLMLLCGSWLLRDSNATPSPQDGEKIRAVVASAGEGIVTFDEYGMIESFNESAEAMFSYTASEIIGTPFRNLFISSERDRCDLFLMTYRPQGMKRIGSSLKEFNAIKKDGTRFLILVTLTEAPLWGHRLFTALLRDVTEQKSAECRLKAQYAIARVLAECSTIQEATPEILRAVCESLQWQLGVLWQVDPVTQLLHCVEVWPVSSDRFVHFLSVTQEMSFRKGVGLPGRIWETGKPIWIPDAVTDHNFPRAPMASQAGLHAAFAFPIRLGEVIHGVMEFFSHEIQEPDEALLHQMLSVGSQIGQFMQRKQIEMALRENEEQNRLILDTALDAVVTIDANGRIIQWNSQAEHMFGWSRQEILGHPIVTTIIPERYRSAHLQGIRHYLDSPAGEILNKRIALSGLHRDGYEFPLEIALTAFRSKNGIIFSGFIRDLTEQRRTEQALQKSEEQRRQAQKMEAMGTLAGGIAHDFNNILSAIIGYTELAMAQIGNGNAVLPRLQEVLRASYRAKHLVRQILTFSRQEQSGKEVTYLQPIIEEALDLLRVSLPSTITIHAELDMTCAPVEADSTQIHQVVMNLGANAEYAMRETGGRLVVKLDAVEVDATTASGVPGLQLGSYICLRVQDSGQGMAPQIIKRIFDPFFTTKDVGKGTGMGLSVIHGIVTGHGGAIQVESQERVGTTFTIYLPCSTESVEGKMGASVSPSLQGMGTVLFVDDEEPIAEWGKDMLGELGYDVVTCTNGFAALERFKREPDKFDVIVTDQTMPGMTGESLARHVMSIRPGFPVILCTGFSYLMTKEKALDIGIRAYLNKPIPIAEMAQAIRQALGRSVPS